MKQPNVLLVDDDEGLLKLYTKILETQGIKVDSVGNGTEADFKVNRVNYDLIITDIQMPYTDGVTLINNVRNGLGNSKTAIVVVSGVLNKQHVMALAKRNISKIFSKPINIPEFATYVNTLLQIPGNPAALQELLPSKEEPPAITEDAEEFEIQ